MREKQFIIRGIDSLGRVVATYQGVAPLIDGIAERIKEMKDNNIGVVVRITVDITF